MFPFNTPAEAGRACPPWRVTTVSSSRRVGSLAGLLPHTCLVYAGLLPHTGLVPPLASARDAGADAGRLRAAAAAAAAAAAVGGASPYA